MHAFGTTVALAAPVLTAVAGLVMAFVALLREIRAWRNSRLPIPERPSGHAASSDEPGDR